jgi:hypothetical protein
MRVTCEGCGRIHEIAETRVPLFGARLRCAACGRLFEIPAPEHKGTAGAFPVRPEPPRPPDPSPAPGSGIDDAIIEARQLARMLLTDIAYGSPARLAAARERGRVLRDYTEEIQKAWTFYRRRVGESVADPGSVFREAVNEVLGSAGEPTPPALQG